jgi:hypothetical protein
VHTSLQILRQQLRSGVRNSRMRLKSKPLVVFVVACIAACSARRDDPRLLAVRRDRLVQIDPRSGEAHEVAAELAGKIVTGRPFARGRAVIVGVMRGEGGEVWRIDVGPYKATRLWAGKEFPLVEGVSDDGKVISVGVGRVLVVDEHPHVVDLHPPKIAMPWSGDVSGDGQHIAISFAPSCDSARGRGALGCKFEIWGYDRRAPDRGWQQIAGGPTVAYNPRFIPGRDELAFHAAKPDPSCSSELWGCKVEDTFRVPFSGGVPTLVRTRAWTPRFTPDGRWMMVANSWDKQLLAGPVDGALAPIAGEAHFAGSWSTDGVWLSYVLPTMNLAVVRRDGRARREVGDGRDVGWIATPLPIGAPAAPTPTAAEREQNELAVLREAYERRHQDGERLVTATELAELARAPERVFAILDMAQLCSLPARAVPVIEKTESHVLATNHLRDAASDLNPLRAVFLDAMPAPRIALDVTYADAVTLIGVDVPERVSPGERFTVALYYRVDAVPPRWRTFVHFDSDMRFSGDHDATLCPTHRWRPGDYIVDRFVVTAARAPGSYRMWVGFFTGGPGTYINATVTRGAHDPQNRVEIARVVVE